MKRYINFSMNTENENFEVLLQKRTDSEEPEYQIEFRDEYGESLLTTDLSQSEFNEFAKAVNKLKREV